MTTKSSHRPVYAEDEVLAAHGAVKQSLSIVNSTDTCSGSPSASAPAAHAETLDMLRHNSGWLFSACHSKIVNENEGKRLSNAITTRLCDGFSSIRSAKEAAGEDWLLDDSIPVNGCRLHLPPMLFGNDIFRMQFGSAAISFNAADALLCWAAQVSKPTG
jgi:hypothetical protein